MSRTVSLANLVARAKRRADMSNSTFRTTAEWEDEVQQSAQAFWCMLLSHRGHAWDFAQTDLTTTASQAYVALPADFLELVKVGWVAASGDDPYRLEPFALEDEWLPDVTRGWDLYSIPAYAIRGQNLWLTPTPDTAYTLRMQYIPRLATLTDSGSPVQLDGIAGWDDWVTWDVAIKMRIQEESDVRTHLAERERTQELIIEAATNRDRGTPHRVQRVRAATTWRRNAR